MTQIFLKPSLAIFEQIALLSSRGLVIDDPAAARHGLAPISYYRLRAYWLYFESRTPSGDHQFVPGTTFSDVLALYDFDRRLRLLMNDAIERIEVGLRGSWAHRLAMEHGPHGYLDPKHYPNARLFERNIAQLQLEYDRSHEVFVTHYKTAYASPALPPVWMAAEFISFGLLSKFLSAIGSRLDSKEIARGFGLNANVLASFAHHLAAIRNICAHHGRLWNRRLTVTMPVPRQPADLSATVEPNATRQLYNTLSVMQFVMARIAPDSSWKSRLLGLLLAHPTGDLTAMGFPADWQTRPVWR